MSTVEEHLHQQMILMLVQKQIFCPVTGDVLDFETCAVVRDEDGDPVGVYAPTVLDALADPVLGARIVRSLAAKGLTVTENPAKVAT